MFPGYVRYAGGDQGWMQELVANGAESVKQYGQWIANRYKKGRILYGCYWEIWARLLLSKKMQKPR